MEERNMNSLERRELEDRIVARKALKRMNKKYGGIALAIILALIPYVWGFSYLDFCLHKNQVQVDNVRMADRGWDEADGEHFIQFYVDMEFGREEANCVSFHTLVYKNGKFIGYINTDIDAPASNHDGELRYAFDTKAEKTLYFNVSGGNNLSKSGDLFRELYDGNPEDYTFEVKFMGARFTDGTTVGHIYLQDYFDYQYDENGEIHFTDSYLSKQGYWWK